MLPVKLTFLTCGWAMSASVTAGALAGFVDMKLSTPLGRPASWKMEAMLCMTQGANSDPLSTTVHPAAMGYKKDRVPRI